MAGNPATKEILLHTFKILKDETDSEHPMNAERICQKLSEKGFSCERKAIYSNVEALNNCGFDVSKNARGFYLEGREFEVPEICLLCDAVETADFISPKKTKQLTDKLQKLLSRGEAQKIHRQIFIENRKKSNNERVLINIDAISDAIDRGLKIKVVYSNKEYTCGKVTKKERTHMLSPYALTWADDHYYLIANNEKYDNLMHLRIDRIISAEVMENKPLRRFSEVSEYKTFFDVADYCNKAFNMFGGEKRRIELLCDNSMLEIIHDRFGEKLWLFPEGNDKFRLLIDANVSKGLIAWILQYATELEVLSPSELREDIKIKVEKLAKMYSVDHKKK